MTKTLPRLERKEYEKIKGVKGNGEGYVTDLSAKANLAGRIGMSGAVRKATEKQTAAPNKHAPKPINLGKGDDLHEKRGHDVE